MKRFHPEVDDGLKVNRAEWRARYSAKRRKLFRLNYTAVHFQLFHLGPFCCTGLRGIYGQSAAIIEE